MSDKRDSQRQKVYDAEKAHSHYKEAIEVGPDGWRMRAEIFEDGTPIPSVKEVQDYVDKVTRSRWFKARWPRYAYSKGKMVMTYGGKFIKQPHGIVVLDGRRRRSAYGSSNGSIAMPRWSRSELVILHEIAHVVTGSSRKIRAHGRYYCSNFLALIRHELGTEAADEMKQLFKEHRVRYVRPKALKVRKKRAR